MNHDTSRGEVFRQLHARTGLFAIPNPWDAGSAKILAALGFEALATTSAGFAYSVGKPDGEGALDLDETLANAKSIVDATPLPVSADLENGFGDTPEACARTITMAAGVGLAGGSIEDATGRDGDPIYPFALALERVSAAVSSAVETAGESSIDGYTRSVQRLPIVNVAADGDLGFTWRALKSGEIEVRHRGKLAATLRGAAAREFAAGITEADPKSAQQWMARLTGNYKRGNERIANDHPRNRK